MRFFYLGLLAKKHCSSVFRALRCNLLLLRHKSISASIPQPISNKSLLSTLIQTAFSLLKLYKRLYNFYKVTYSKYFSLKLSSLNISSIAIMRGRKPLSEISCARSPPFKQIKPGKLIVACLLPGFFSSGF